MNNILNTLAFSVHSNKGAYALLLGSGISAPAAIPTGWDVLMNLIRKIAVLEGEKDIEDPAAWFLDKYGSTPDYSEVLSKLVKTPTERVGLMKPYFEPTEDDRDSGLKAPTPAHISIAQLVKKGFIKVIVTTNFDRLIEKALELEGITPQVIKNENDIEGATPLIHSDCTIIKVNGDYVDCRFLNTSEELSAYSTKWCEYISIVLKDFGLITCGWSGNWDKALSKLVRGSTTNRYTSFFTYKDSYSEPFQKTCNDRHGELIEIKDANHFFTELSERIEALEQIGNVHPLSKEIAVSRIKKYIVKEENRIKLFDLFEGESIRALERINSVESYSMRLTAESFNSLWEMHRSAVHMLIPMCITATQWCTQSNEYVIVDVFKKLTQYPKIKVNTSYTDEGIKCHYLSSLILLYVVGFTAIVYGKYGLLNKILSLSIKDYNSRCPLICTVNSSLLDKRDLNAAIGQNYHTPVSTLLDHRLSEYLIPLVESEQEYNFIFDIFEKMMSLNYLHLCGKSVFGHDWAPWGEYQWRSRHHSRIDNTFTDFFNQADELKDEWPPIKEGMFEGSYETYSSIKERVDRFLTEVVRLG